MGPYFSTHDGRVLKKERCKAPCPSYYLFIGLARKFVIIIAAYQTLHYAFTSLLLFSLQKLELCCILCVTHDCFYVFFSFLFVQY